MVSLMPTTRVAIKLQPAERTPLETWGSHTELRNRWRCAAGLSWAPWRVRTMCRSPKNSA
ncbi:MAG: hypothetical protein ACREYE_21620 [Gammaproteobacteria bacterium]